MENIEFNAYLTDVFRLARTMVIKIEAIALKDNQVQIAAGLPVSSDKRTWRYYMNLNGDYHPNDQIMTILSIDTGDEIVFNKQNMVIHLATFREYSAGGYWFNRLVEKYPGQADLVRGILSPIPYEETIAADDYKILKYNKNLVLWNEDQLIPRLQEWINSEVPQIFNHEYRLTDNLMLSLGVILIYADLIKAICTIRHEAIGTRNVHDFYIWSRIDSYGSFSKYKQSLSLTQIMWLYRNIPWINSNPGSRYTFNLLLDNLLTKGRIPLAEFSMVENTETQVEDLAPTPLYRRLNLNLLGSYGRAATFIDTENIIKKQQYLAKENYDQSAIWYEDALSKGKYSLHSELPTKALESKMLDTSNRHADTTMSVVFNNWIYLAGKGYYKGRILVTDPKNGKQVRLPVGDAYYIWRHLMDISRDQVKTNICPAYYHNVMKSKVPSIEEIIDIGGPEFIKPFLAIDIRNLWIPPKIFISPEYLMEFSNEVYGLMWEHKKVYAQFYDLNKRARVEQAVKYMYESGIVTLTDATTYKELVDRYEFYFEEYTPEEARNFGWEIFKAVTGWDSNTSPSLRVKQSALIDIMMQLSSYTIHTIKEMDDGTDLTELYNEMFVGDSRWTGPGNGSYGDFSSAILDVPSDMDGYRTVEGLTDIVVDQHITSIRETSVFATIVTEDYIKRVDLSTDLYDYAVKIVDDSYIQPVMVPEVDIPPAYCGQLEYPDLSKVIPPTYYGKLLYAGDSKKLPKTFYGQLVYKNLTGNNFKGNNND